MNLEIARRQLADYILQKIELSPEEIQLVVESYDLFQVKKKEFFLKEGDNCKHQGFVVGGTFRVYYTDDKLQEHVLYFGFKDWWVGDVASFNSESPSGINVQAMEDSWVLGITFEKMELMFDKVPKMDRMFRIITQRTLAVLQKRLFLTVSATAEERYKELLNRHPGIEQLVPQHQIASYLGILPESLSRMKKQLIEKQTKKK